MSISVTFQPMGRKVDIAPGESIWVAAEKAHVPIASICGGQSICGKCRVRVLGGEPNSVSAIERKFLTAVELKTGYRLACEVQVYEHIIVETPEIKDDRRGKLQIPVLKNELSFSPGIYKAEVKIPHPSLGDPRSDSARLLGTLIRLGYQPPQLDLNHLDLLPDALRKSNFHMSCVFDDRGFINLEAGNTTQAFYGLAVDLGTTTAAVYLINFDSERIEGAAASSNRQATHGDDVMSRLSYAQSGGSGQLQQLAVETINDLIQQVCAACEVQKESIYAMTIAGNTTMLHLLGGMATNNLGVAPYVATSTEMIPTSAGVIGLQIHPSGTVWLLPGAGAFAGADCVCGALAVEMLEKEEIQLLIDFGTNAEIVLGSRDGLFACATAAGPAFEGARIQHGMRAAPGAIDRVWIDNGCVHVRTIGDLPAVGIAGTGLVSAVASLQESGILDANGIMHYSKSIFPEYWLGGNKGAKILLVPATDERSAITLSQRDISEYQLAKAAVRAGVKLLQRKLGINDYQIQRVYLAGAFGNFIDARDALIAGLLPAVGIDRVESAGNAAGYGAIAALVSQSHREKLTTLANSIKYVELSVEPDFNRLFAKCLTFN